MVNHNKRPIILVVLYTLILEFSGIATAAGASVKLGKSTFSPKQGVICDSNGCANANEGYTIKVTREYLGSTKAKKLQKQGEFDNTQFTFMDGVFCDIKERLCHVDRYYINGQRSAIAVRHTQALFGHTP